MNNETIALGFSEIVHGQRVRYQVSFSKNEAHEALLQSEQADSGYSGDEPIDIELETPGELLPDQAYTRDVLQSVSDNALRINIFKHNDLKGSVDTITSKQLGWWVKEMNVINRQQVNKGNPALFSEIILDFKSDPEIQGFPYKGDATPRKDCAGLPV